MRNSSQDFLGCWGFIFNHCKLSPPHQVRCEPVFCNPSYTVIIKFFNDYITVNSIRSFLKSRETVATYLLSSNWVWIFSIIDMSASFVKQFNRNQIVDYKFLVLGTCLAFCSLVFLLFYWCWIRGRVVHRRIDLLLKIGTTWAILRTVGETPWVKHLFINSKSGAKVYSFFDLFYNFLWQTIWTKAFAGF